MRRIDWWIGVLIVACALLVHAFAPRYEYRHLAGGGRLEFIRIDRWTGNIEAGRVMTTGDHYGRWLGIRQELWESQQVGAR